MTKPSYDLEDDEWLEGCESKEPPVNGWDNPIDIRQAENFLAMDAAPVIKGKLGNEAISNNAEQLRSFGISESKAIKLMRRQWPDYDKDKLKQKIVRAYQAAAGAPGL